MKACRVHHFGPPDVIVFEDIPRPEPGKGEVLVRVKAAGVGPWDAWIRAGKSAVTPPLPLTLGSDLSGVVEAVGPEVTVPRPGTAVFGVTNPQFTGANAEYALAAAGMLATKPSRLGDTEAASVPVVAVTAQQALFEQAGLTAGQRVLVHGAGGNVGNYVVQMARLAGLQVVAAVGPRDVEAVRRLGAQDVIDDSVRRFEDATRGVDAVIDLVGGEIQARSFAILKPGGILVSTVSQPDRQVAARYGVRASFFLVDVTTAQLTRIAGMIDAGELTPRVGAVLALADARMAHEMLEGARPRPGGKIVLRAGD